MPVDFTGGTSGNQLVVDPPSPWIQERPVCSSLHFLTWLWCCSCSEFQYKLCSSRVALKSSHCSFMLLTFQCPKSLEWDWTTIEPPALLYPVRYWSLAPVPSEMSLLLWTLFPELPFPWSLCYSPSCLLIKNPTPTKQKLIDLINYRFFPLKFTSRSDGSDACL